jgi:glycosyltransferase involved in cell wall biosynthesis
MKILYLHQYFVTPAMAGGTRSYELARRLAAAGHEVHVITSQRRAADSAPAAKWSTTLVEGVHVHWTTVPYDNRFGFVRRLRAFVAFAWRAAWKAVTVRGDLVFATSTPLTIAIPAILASRRLCVPMVFEVRDLWPEVPIAMGEIRNPLLIACSRLLEKIAYRCSARVIALSPGMADGVVAAGYPRERVEVIPNACDIELFGAPPAAAADGLLPPGNGQLVVYTGTFGRANAVGYLVSVAAAMRALDPTVRFLLVGDGSELEAIRQQARDNGTLDSNLWMRPPIRKEQVPTVLAHATLATATFADVKALWHNSANKVFDALAAGRPVMINYGGWQKEFLETSGAGFAVPGNDSAAGAQHLAAFLRSPDAIARARTAALQVATTQFNRDRLGERFRAVLEDAAAGSAAPRARTSRAS